MLCNTWVKVFILVQGMTETWVCISWIITWEVSSGVLLPQLPHSFKSILTLLYLLLVFTSSFTETVKKSAGSLFSREAPFFSTLTERGGHKGEGRDHRGGWSLGHLPQWVLASVMWFPSSPKPMLNLSSSSKTPGRKKLLCYQFKAIVMWGNNTKIINILIFTCFLFLKGKQCCSPLSFYCETSFLETWTPVWWGGKVGKKKSLPNGSKGQPLLACHRQCISSEAAQHWVPDSSMPETSSLPTQYQQEPILTSHTWTGLKWE